MTISATGTLTGNGILSGTGSSSGTGTPSGTGTLSGTGLLSGTGSSSGAGTPSGTGNSISISIPYEETTFGANATLSLKSFIADPILVTGNSTPSGINNSSFSSQMFLVTLEASDYAVTMDETYSLQTM